MTDLSKYSINGITNEQAEKSRLEYGSNKMTKKKRKSLSKSFLENLGDPVIKVLIISLMVNILFTLHNIDWFETGGIIIAILLATTISTLSEHSSRLAFEKLSTNTQTKIRVRRNGNIHSLPTEEIVVGDIILLSAGNKICADGVLVLGDLSLDQSALTGESKEISKSPVSFNQINENDELLPSSSHSCLNGSLVSSGEGEMLVLRVGDNSFLGGIVQELQSETRESPLKIRLSKLAKQISSLGYGAAILISFLSLFSSIIISLLF